MADDAATALDASSPPTALPSLPSELVLGVSSSAFQVEGATAEDGRRPSIWDSFCGEPGRIADGASADVACDHYHRWREDLDLLAALGVDAYRFSVAWPRVVPAGAGRVEQRGLAFYDRLVDGLLERGIQPLACLFHWDLPLSLQARGGWTSRETSERFAEYAGAVAERLGDRVAAWATLNEPFVHLSRGHLIGQHAPGVQVRHSLPVAHHLLLAHGWAAQALRTAAPGAPVGLIESVAPIRPLDASEADRAAADALDGIRNHLFLTPVLCGEHHEQTLTGADDPAQIVQPGDLAAIAAPIDFVGVNYYGSTTVKAPSEGNPFPFEIVPPNGRPVTGMGLAIDPDGLGAACELLAARYGERLPPLVVTEIGCGYDDELSPDGTCRDERRIAYLDAHLKALAAAVARGADVRGCLVWSLLDNFEWELGYTQRLGLVHVDFATLRRTPKQSFAWLAQLLRERPGGRRTLALGPRAQSRV